MIKQPLLAYEILCVLFIKCMIIWGLWYFCFAHPITKQALPDLTANHLFNFHLDPAHDQR